MAYRVCCDYCNSATEVILPGKLVSAELVLKDIASYGQFMVGVGAGCLRGKVPSLDCKRSKQLG